MNFKSCPPFATTDHVSVHRQRVLVVDDDEFIRQINYEILLSAGYEVDVANDGAAAWDALQLQNYDLMVTDNQMPNLCGVELVEKIRNAGMTLPIIMATGNLPGEEFFQQHANQPIPTLLKPYTHTELLGTVEAVLCAANAGEDTVTLVPNWESQPTVFGLRLGPAKDFWLPIPKLS